MKKLLVVVIGLICSLLFFVLFIFIKQDSSNLILSSLKLSYQISKENGYKKCKDSKDIFIALDSNGEFYWIKSFWEGKEFPKYKESDLKIDINEKDFSVYIIEKGFFDGQKQCILSTPN